MTDLASLPPMDVAGRVGRVRAALDGRYSPVRADAGKFGRPDPEGRGPVGIINIESESELARVAAEPNHTGLYVRPNG